MEPCIGEDQSHIHPRSHFDPVVSDTQGFTGAMDINLMGSVLGLKYGIQALRKRGGGSITMTGSSNAGGAARGAWAGPFGDLTMLTPYALTSAALDQLTRISAYYQNENIRVYGLKPGITSSELLTEFLDVLTEKEEFADMNEDDFSGFNLFFKGVPADSVHVGGVVKVRPYPNRDPRVYPHSH